MAQMASTPTNDDYLVTTDILNKAIKSEPDNYELYFERSICHHNLGDYQASLDDANTAIRLNSSQSIGNTEIQPDYGIHYQKGLALTGLKMFSEAVISFKKAIELRAKQEDSKLSDIFKLLRDAINEINTARRKPGRPESGALPNGQTATGLSNTHIQLTQGTAIPSNNNTSNNNVNTNNDPVDSTTDKPLFMQQPGTSTNQNPHLYKNHQSLNSLKSLTQTNGSSNLVASNCNINPNMNLNQPIPNTSQLFKGNFIGPSHRVSSSASHLNSHLNLPPIGISTDISSINPNTHNIAVDLLHNPSTNQQTDQSRAAQFEWNIRRSERIFLHHSGESGPGSNYGILPIGTMTNQPQRLKSGSNPSSINSGSKSGTKRPHDQTEPQAYHQNKVSKSREGTESHVDSDIDVEDTSFTQSSVDQPSKVGDAQNVNLKRVMIAPSSSMPATPGQSSSTNPANKDDSYSSKYKRLRRDRERARRGTSKHCTIKASDLEELQKSSSSGQATKRFMRVIAPIDGWLYSGQLSADENCAGTNCNPQYVVKLDGDSTGSCYLFSAETVLNDVIKEVRVKSVSELRKGARICCYWSRQYKCLSTGVVTSRTFEATKSLVSVKYDNGDLSALPLEDLRLLPPDYPKYMSNCDPLLLARNGDGAHVTNAIATSFTTNTDSNTIQNGSRVNADSKPNGSINTSNDLNDMNHSCGDEVKVTNDELVNVSLAEKSQATDQNTKIIPSPKNDSIIESYHDDNTRNADEEEDDRDDDATIPPTDETIEFITSESTLKQQDDNHLHETNVETRLERVPVLTKDSITTNNEAQINNNTDTSRASSEENTYCGIEYRPWMFEGPPRRSKRHGRTYRDNYSSIRRGNEVIRIGDSAELMPREEGILPFVAKIDGLWATGRGEMRVRVRWYYRLIETEGEPNDLPDRDNALFETDHFDENDVQSIYKTTRILSWTDYKKNNLGHVNNINFVAPKIFYLAGYYDPVRRIKHLRSDVKEAL